MRTESRYDRAIITPISSENGFFKCRVAIARPGVFPYLYADGSLRMEAKLPEEIHSAETIESAKGAPVTDGHVPRNDSGGKVTPENWNKYVKGTLGDSIDIEGDLLFLNETIFDSALAADVKSGKKCEASIGFDAMIDDTPGEYDGVKYDCAQRRIKINHVAHVPKGRAGDTVRAYFDEDIPDGSTLAVMQNTNQETVMKNQTKTDEGAIFEGVKRFFAMFGRQDAEPEGSDDPKVTPETGEGPKTTAGKGSEEGKNKPSQADIIEFLQAQVAALQDLLDKKAKELEEATSPAKQDEAIKERLSLIDLARKAIPDFKHDGLSNREIRLAVINANLPFPAEMKTDSLTDIHISARFDAAAALLREKASIGGSGSEIRTDEADISAKRQKRLNMFEG